MFRVINIIPTGLGASIGGFAGDANPINSVLEELCDEVITHPNTVNAASLYPATKKTLYVEGFALDNFINKQIFLESNKYQNKIGIIIDKTAVKNNFNHIINAINSSISVFGCDIVGYSITDSEILPKVVKLENGLFDGEIGNTETIYDSAEKLIEKGANALAIFSMIYNPYEDDEKEYGQGNSADPIGRIEAIISHILVEKYNLPAAHAPVLDEYKKVIVDPRVASEEIGYTFIPCVLRGLQSAPQFSINETKNTISINDVSAILVPYNSLNGKWLKGALENNIKIIAIKQNKTVLNDTADILGIENKVILVENYLEVLGILLSIKAKVNYHSLLRPLKSVESI